MIIPVQITSIVMNVLNLLTTVIEGKWQIFQEILKIFFSLSKLREFKKVESNRLYKQIIMDIYKHFSSLDDRIPYF